MREESVPYFGKFHFFINISLNELHPAAYPTVSPAILVLKCVTQRRAIHFNPFVFYLRICTLFPFISANN
jgi:hypothetical protein